MTRRVTKRLVRLGRWLVAALVTISVASAAFVYVRWVYRERRFDSLIVEIAAQQGADRHLIKAVMRQESGFDPFARSARGAIGLMQVTEAAGKDWARATGRKNFHREQLWDPRTNIEAGTWYLQRALNRWADRPWDERLPFALAEYNAGYANVVRWLPKGRDTTSEEFMAAITYPGVRHYIRKVTTYYEHYRERDSPPAKMGGRGLPASLPQPTLQEGRGAAR
ncbi:MAG: lytic transglycosylase domain-containing protein [Verrucomicrobiae bacterium]|nr:lytic transglycosylase domain-containing protein [Verrucomicrobiae bacterium]